jgi:hypothetical protein
MDLAQVAAELFKQQATFVYDFFQAAELEARATERYVLVALAGMYSYLATKEVPRQFRRLAWYAPTLVTVFAGIRALGLGWRQRQTLDYLIEMERRLPPPNQVRGWGQWFTKQVPFVSISAGVFYVLLIILTLVIAHRMTKTPDVVHNVSAQGE